MLVVTMRGFTGDTAADNEAADSMALVDVGLFVAF